MYVCMSVHSGFMVEVYMFYVGYVPHCLAGVLCNKDYMDDKKPRDPLTKTVNLLYGRENM